MAIVEGYWDKTHNNPNNKKCAFFEDRICDDGCMAYYMAFHEKDHQPTFSCKRLIITLDNESPVIF